MSSRSLPYFDGRTGQGYFYETFFKIYEDSLERAAEDYGPNSSQLEDKVKEVNTINN